VSSGTRLWVALATVYTIWGSTYLGIALAVETMPPLFAVSSRFLAAGLILAAIVALRGGLRALRIRRIELAAVTLVGVLFIGANALLFFAERTVPIGLASLVIASVPLWVAVFRIVAGDRPPTVVLASITAGFVGVAFLVRPSGDVASWGLVLVLLSAFAWSVGSFLSPRLPLPRDAFTATAYEMGIGGLVFFPLGLAAGPDPAEFSARSILGWAYLVIFGAVVGYTAYVWLLGHAPLSLVATYAYVNPVIAITLGALVLDESITVSIVIGATIVLTSVAVVVRREPPMAEPAPIPGEAPERQLAGTTIAR
jgi:drug/metabolite transporter (DMT)-like permease